MTERDRKKFQKNKTIGPLFLYAIIKRLNKSIIRLLRRGRPTMSIILKTISSFEKIRYNDNFDNYSCENSGICLANEHYSFQLIYRYLNKKNTEEETSSPEKLNLKVKVTSELIDCIKVSRVEQVSVPTVRLLNSNDTGFIDTVPGLYPDLLSPLDENEIIRITSDSLFSLWIEVRPTCDHVGVFPITVDFYKCSSSGLEEKVASTTYSLTVSDTLLPPQELIHTEWLYADCLKSYYNTDTFDDRHWQIIENFMRSATSHGINMILTPLFTYPLDTAVGHERPTTQLVDVFVNADGSYSFNYALLEKFVHLALSCGYIYFEMGHLFTQWGATSAPKIYAHTVSGSTKLFGWDTPSTSAEYTAFLDSFLPDLVKELKKLNIWDVTFFHISDEPREAFIDRYLKCREIVSKHIPMDKICDAMSSYAFYEQGVLKRPVPATHHIKDFIGNNVPNLWTYYCCTARKGLSNRFIAMPSARTRALGFQLYYGNIKGFLHWGFNFYYSQLSLNEINPFVSTDCDGFAESGDAFLVYPGSKGIPMESIRLKLMDEAMQDYRLCVALEQKKGRDFVINIINSILGDFDFNNFTYDSNKYIKLISALKKELLNI